MLSSTLQRHCLRRNVVAGFRLFSSGACREATPIVAPAQHGHSMPPGFTATVGQFQTFMLPDKVTRCRGHIEMGMDLISAWRRDGIIQIAMTEAQQKTYQAADASSRGFFGRKPAEKSKCVDPSSYSGYVGSGEEITNGIADYSEIFTVTKDLKEDDPRVNAKWPCHGPCPWPDQSMKQNIDQYMGDLGENGHKLLQLIELGLDVSEGSLTDYSNDGWHHMRILRFPAENATNGKGKAGRGIGSHTDYGLLVIAAQDEVGGLFIRPPHKDEKFANWNSSAAGHKEDDAGWVYVPPVPGVFTVFPGDMMQYMTGSFLPSTPHKVGLNTRERFAFAYFHGPNFRSMVRPLPAYATEETEDAIHYGTHFTNMCLRNYPDRITTAKLLEDDRYEMLNTPALRAD